MNTIKYTDCFNEVLPEMPGVSTAMAENAIRNAVIEFCKRSGVWRHWADPQNVVAGVSTYDLEPAPQSDVASIVVLKVDDEKCNPASEDHLEGNWQTERGTVDRYMQQDMTSVTLVKVPDLNISRGLTMTLSLMPRRASASFPAWIWNQYYEGIAQGAKAKLMAMPKKPWTDQKTALYYQLKFDSAIAGATADAARSLTRAALRTATQH
jgi:hypothetical protein